LIKKPEYTNSVIICFNYGLKDDNLFYQVSETLSKLVGESGIGFYDGHEIAMDHTDGSYYLYGENAEDLFKLVLPYLSSIPFMKGSVALLKFGDDPSAHAIELQL